MRLKCGEGASPRPSMIEPRFNAESLPEISFIVQDCASLTYAADQFATVSKSEITL